MPDFFNRLMNFSYSQFFTFIVLVKLKTALLMYNVRNYLLPVTLMNLTTGQNEQKNLLLRKHPLPG